MQTIWRWIDMIKCHVYSPSLPNIFLICLEILPSTHAVFPYPLWISAILHMHLPYWGVNFATFWEISPYWAQIYAMHEGDISEYALFGGDFHSILHMSFPYCMEISTPCLTIVPYLALISTMCMVKCMWSFLMHLASPLSIQTRALLGLDFRQALWVFRVHWIIVELEEHIEFVSR